MLTVPTTVTDNLHTDRSRTMSIIAVVAMVLAVAVLAALLVAGRATSTTSNRTSHSTTQQDACRPTLVVHAC